ncbi:MAG: Lrp/AsnC family transcriptional regulator [Candidatus Omnitrophica bacterium]|nr:Lrp/AsnC family transcriptional regulator [Candidatus Omnitrophota bacterium]
MKEILEILENNARISTKDLAKLTKKKEKDVVKEIKNLEKKGVIVKYKTVINKDLAKEENATLAIIEVKVTPQKDLGFDYIAERIYRFEEVKSCYLLSGTYDLLLIVEGKDLHTVANFVAEKLAPLESVKGTISHFMLKKYKEDGVVLKRDKDRKRLTITY